MRSRAAAALLALSALAASGCALNKDAKTYEFQGADLPESAALLCDGEMDAEAVAPDADVNVDASDTLGDGGVVASYGCAWQSSGWNSGDWIKYPGRATLRLFHPLGRVPATVLVYLSFERSGEGAALSAGDLAHVGEVTDEFVEIENFTNGDYFARIVLQ